LLSSIADLVDPGMPGFLICFRRGFHKRAKIKAKNKPTRFLPGGGRETLLRYPHSGVRVQQHRTAGMERLRMRKIEYAAPEIQSNLHP
jgi:hypothetical protein